MLLATQQRPKKNARPCGNARPNGGATPRGHSETRPQRKVKDKRKPCVEVSKFGWPFPLDSGLLGFPPNATTYRLAVLRHALIPIFPDGSTRLVGKIFGFSAPPRRRPEVVDGEPRGENEDVSAQWIFNQKPSQSGRHWKMYSFFYCGCHGPWGNRTFIINFGSSRKGAGG